MRSGAYGPPGPRTRLGNRQHAAARPQHPSHDILEELVSPGKHLGKTGATRALMSGNQKFLNPKRPQEDNGRPTPYQPWQRSFAAHRPSLDGAIYRRPCDSKQGPGHEEGEAQHPIREVALLHIEAA